MSLYSILGLHGSLESFSEISPAAIKAAHRKALLLHHPDKSLVRKQNMPSGMTYTVDEINAAYSILSDPGKRRKYDQSLRVQLTQPPNQSSEEHSGLDTVDLDDMHFDKTLVAWYRSCRCGNQRGFTVTESELEKEAQHGEVLVGCDGCSLWLRITFQLADEDG